MSEVYLVFLSKEPTIVIMLFSGFESSNFIYRNLSADNDDLEEYLSWMRNLENTFVESVRGNFTEAEILEFVIARNASLDSLLIGVFDRYHNQHIANVKFEPINFVLGHAWMGILLGNPSMRGKGFASEIIDASCEFLTEVYGIRDIFLGVDVNNTPALKAYKRCYFKESELQENNVVIMVRRRLA